MVSWVAAALVTAMTVAQEQPPAAVVGVAIDSLRGGPLRGATVMVTDGGGRQGSTDSAGRFVIDSVPPGAHRLALFHPLLDELNVSVSSAPILFHPGEAVHVAIATPSPARLLGRICPADSASSAQTGLQPTALIGRVLAPGADTPVADVTVTLVWTAVDANKSQGVVERTQTRSATTDAGGRFQVCGPPGVTRASLRAVHGDATTALVPLSLSQGGVVLPVLHLLGTARVARASGRVVDQHNNPIAGASVEVIEAAQQATTDSNGRFALNELPEGTQTIAIRANGYGATTQTVDLSASRPWQGSIQLVPAPPLLPTVRISAAHTQSGYDAVGFTARKERGVGTFMTAEDIEHKHPQTTMDVFEYVPGLYIDHEHGVIIGSRGKTSIMGASGACVNLFVDGQRMTIDAQMDTTWAGPQKAFTPLDINKYIELTDIAAVEVYNPSELPPIFERVGDSCQTIVIWTKAQIVDRVTR